VIIATSFKQSGCPETPMFRADSDLGWKSPSQYFPGPGPEWSQWLLDPGSLTQRLVSLSDGKFQVEVLDECWSRQYSAALLPCFGSRLVKQLMWSRQVVLKGNGTPWVAAHSLIPTSSLRGSLRQLSKLQSRPLGAFLFRHPSLVRDKLEIARVGDGWGRRSVFYLYDKPLLVAEFFLPALLNYQISERKIHDRSQ
jgi:chorismate lyase